MKKIILSIRKNRKAHFKQKVIVKKERKEELSMIQFCKKVLKFDKDRQDFILRKGE